MSHSPRTPRGVTVSINQQTGRALIRCIDSAGVCRAKIELAADDVDRATLLGCENWLHGRDPVAAAPTALRLVG